ncbi:hypothetical protein OBBRIDRAFT_797560 [Obba rivulosa]|uniref:Uncharacterized protein n=1 Tax=Obba rivulosa TaxID=1052685 RepID=A0A8E2AKU6_9APHY|nr:hypothetical protein OBBRIDRAFT_797560 [Obba rivulosa]
MSSALPPPAQGRSWWLRSKPSRDSSSLKPDRSLTNLAYDEKSSSAAGPSKPKDSGSKFNTFASAIGLKSRKPPPLDIQDPPAVLTVVHPPAAQGRVDTRRREPTATASPVSYSRPPVKSISTVRSTEYDGDAASDPHTISEPRTPSDHARDRSSYQTSVLSWSDPDPFAAGSIIIQPLMQDPNRLSVYSDSSVLDPLNMKTDFVPHNRISYGSSLSSSSQGHSSERHAGGVVSTLPNVRARTRSNSGLSPGASVPERRPDFAKKGEAAQPASSGEEGASSRHKTPSGSNSSCSTVSPGHKFSDLPGAPRSSHIAGIASMRARGMTVAAASGKPVRQLKTSASTLGLSIPPSSSAPSLQRKLSESSADHHSPDPAPSPLTFARSRSGSSATGNESPISSNPPGTVRKVSLSRGKLPPLNSAPPSTNLPDVPMPPPKFPFVSSPVDSLEDLSTLDFPEPPSSSSSSLSFAPGIDPDAAFSSVTGMFGNIAKAGRRLPQAAAKVAKKAQNREKSKTVQNDPNSPSATVRNFEVDIVPAASSSKFSPFAGSSDHTRSAHATSSKMLKKASSQQSLASKRLSAASQTSSMASGFDEAADGYNQSPSKPRKQRSFHHSRLPIPPLPALRHTNSYNAPPPPQSPGPSSPLFEQRRGSSSSQAPPQGRKRLFSASSIRKSTSSHTPNSPVLSAEDDHKSIASFDTDSRYQSRPTSSNGEQKVAMSFGSFGSPLSMLTMNSCVSPSSFWDDSGIGPKDQVSSQSSKRVSQMEYVPQQIMSPADMLKLEEELAREAEEKELECEWGRQQERKPKLDLSPGDFGYSFVRPGSGSRDSRPRASSTFSRTSTSTSAFGHSSEEQYAEQDDTRGAAESLPSVVSRQSSIATIHAKSGNVPLRSSSMQSKSSYKASIASSRPSTGQSGRSPPSSPSFSSFTRSPERPPMGLPPPPRSRRPTEVRPATQPEPTNQRTSVVPVIPLSPPPTHGKTRRPSTSPVDAREFGQPAPPPSAFHEQMLKRRSIMKKPSFLDIDDDDDGDTAEEDISESEMEPSSPTLMESSFLDLGRGSFDTVRSFDSDV